MREDATTDIKAFRQLVDVWRMKAKIHFDFSQEHQSKIDWGNAEMLDCCANDLDQAITQMPGPEPCLCCSQMQPCQDGCQCKRVKSQ